MSDTSSCDTNTSEEDNSPFNTVTHNEPHKNKNQDQESNEQEEIFKTMNVLDNALIEKTKARAREVSGWLVTMENQLGEGKRIRCDKESIRHHKKIVKRIESAMIIKSHKITKSMDFLVQAGIEKVLQDTIDNTKAIMGSGSVIVQFFLKIKGIKNDLAVKVKQKVLSDADFLQDFEKKVKDLAMECVVEEAHKHFKAEVEDMEEGFKKAL